MAELISGQVAKVLTSRNLVINRGREDGVRPGMKFAVLDPRTQDVTDPKTGQSLGSIELTKVKVQVTRVADYLAIAQTYEVESPGHPTGLGNIASLFASSGYMPTTFVSLRGADGGRDELEEGDSYVKRGDPVVEIVETETSAEPEHPAASESQST